MVARTVKQPWISSMGNGIRPGPGPGPGPDHQYRHRCCYYYIIALVFLCLVILLDVAGADSGYNGYKMGLNHRGVHDPPNFDFVTKKQEKLNKVNLDSTSHLNRESFQSVEDSLILSSENSAGENSVNSDEPGISGNGNFMEPDPNPYIVTTAEESSDDNLDSSSNSNQIQYQDLSSNAESSLENLTPSDSQNQDQDETQQLEETILEAGSDEKEIQRIARRISGLSQTHPRPLQNQYPNHNGGHQNHEKPDRKFEGWKVIDDDERGGTSGEPVWHGSGSRSRNPNASPNRHPNSISNPNGPSPGTIHPNGKTIGPLPSLPSLDIVEDPGYDHGPRPKWPLNEYLVDKFNSFYRPNFYETTRNKTEVNGPTKHSHQHQQLHQQGWQWQQLQPHRQHQPQHFGSSASESHHNFDSTKFYHLDEDDFGNQDQTRYWSNDNLYNTNLYGNHGHGHGHKQAYSYRGYNSPHREHQSGTNGHETSVSTTAEVGKGISNDGVTSTSTSSRDVLKHLGHDHGPHGHAHYFPPDYYPKKRFRLQIHPGYIAAPIAGLAAFGAASALTKKPLLFELGLVNNKHHYPKPIHYPGGYPGHHHHHGWASNIVPNYYPSAHSANGLGSGGLGGHPGVGDGPVYPIIKPEASHHQKPVVHSHGHNHQHSHNHNHNFGWAQLQPHNQNQQNHHHHHGNGNGNGWHENSHHGHGHALHHQQQHSGEGDKKPWWNPFAALTPRD